MRKGMRMRGFLLIILTTVIVSCSSSRNTKLSIKIDSKLHSIMSHYILHAESYELDIDKFTHLRSIEFKSNRALKTLTSLDLAGATIYDESSNSYRIFLSEEILKFGPTFVEIVLYHELWHVYRAGAPHCNSGDCLFIFNSSLGPESIEEWNSTNIERYFLTLKN